MWLGSELLEPGLGSGYFAPMGGTPVAAAQTPSDEELALRVARGDTKALGLLYDRHASLLLGIAVRIVRDRDAAHDVVHDVFVEAWRSIEGYDSRRGRVRAWLVTRLRSRAVDRLRAGTRHRDRIEKATTSAGSESPNPERGLDAARVPGWVASLPAPQREALELAYFEGLSMKEIAERQGIAVGTAKARVCRAVARLREERGGEP